jgi:hypothetical protein
VTQFHKDHRVLSLFSSTSKAAAACCLTATCSVDQQQLPQQQHGSHMVQRISAGCGGLCPFGVPSSLCRLLQRFFPGERLHICDQHTCNFCWFSAAPMAVMHPISCSSFPDAARELKWYSVLPLTLDFCSCRETSAGWLLHFAQIASLCTDMLQLQY